MKDFTLAALAAFPDQLEAHYSAIPAGFALWEPTSWEGIPSEHFNALGQLCHIRDIEIDGYHARFLRTLAEENPWLPGIDGEALAVERRYAQADAVQVLAAIREARARTVAIIDSCMPAQLDRPAAFEGYGDTTFRGLAHYLCSHDQQHLAGLQWLLGMIESARAAMRSGEGL